MNRERQLRIEAGIAPVDAAVVGFKHKGISESAVEMRRIINEGPVGMFVEAWVGEPVAGAVCPGNTLHAGFDGSIQA